MSFTTFVKAAKTVITLGASLNAQARQEIRTVVGELGDEFDRALMLTDSFLVGAKFSRDDPELARYLADVDNKLRSSYHEHHLCAGLYQLADKFEQLFDPTRFSVDWHHSDELRQLISELKNGEQVVIDDLGDIAAQLRDLSAQLHDGQLQRDQVLAHVEAFRSDVARFRRTIKDKRRAILRTM